MVRQVLIELGPTYFRYIESTASRATVLAKLVGFYTIEIRNLETGAVQSKADLLVMENLFYNRKINQTFDLKGIQGRKVKAKHNGKHHSKTLFDGEWIEGIVILIFMLKSMIDWLIGWLVSKRSTKDVDFVTTAFEIDFEGSDKE